MTMTIKQFCLLIFVFFSTTTKAQSITKGTVTEQTGKGLPFVSVILLHDTTFIIGTITNENGTFYIKYPCLKGQKYNIRFSAIGYAQTESSFICADTTTLNATLTAVQNTLSEVTITAKKPLITRRADRYILNVENSFLATGNSALDVLRKSPGLWIGNDGTIRIRGNQTVTVMINDVVQRMSEQEISEYFKSLKSEDISRIEIIHTPPSEFEAAGSGGIVHIILKASKKNGLNGSVNAQYRQQGKSPLISSGTSLDYKLDKLVLFGGYTFTSDKINYYSTSDVVYPDNSLYHTYTDINNNVTRNQYRIGATYDLSKNHSIGIQSIGTFNKYIQPFLTDIDYQSNQHTTGTALSDRERKTNQNSTTLNYIWKIDSLGSSLKFIADYTKSNNKEINNFSSKYNDPTQNSVYRNNTPNTTNIYSFQTDYTKNFKNKLQLKAGFKYVQNKRDNEVLTENFIGNVWTTDINSSNHFIYDENIEALYSSLEKTIQKTNVKVGVRAEQTTSKGNSLTSSQTFSKKYTGLFPSLFVLHTFNEEEGNSMYFSFARRLRRPNFNEINPYTLKLDNYSVQIGNPDLQPEYSNSFEIGYNYHNNYSFDIYYNGTKNIIANLINPLPNNIIEYQYQNFNKSSEYGADLSVPIKFTKIWTSNNNISVYHLSYSINNFSIEQTSLSAKSVQTISLKKVVDIDAVADYRSSYVYANSKIPYMFYFDIGFTRKILKEKGRLRLYFTDIFNTLRDKATTNYNNTKVNFYQKRPTQTVSLSFSYNISSGKQFNRKNFEQSNNDERNRIGN